MSEDFTLQLVTDLEQEAARWRRRTMFLLSVILHGVMIGLLLFAPDLFHRGAEMMGINLQPAPKRESSYLYLPPDVLRRMKPPPTPNLSDKNRRAQGRAPLVDPNGLRMPYSRGNTPLPEVAGGGKPKPPPAPPPTPPAGANSPAPQGGSAPPAPRKEEEQQEARLQLQDVPAHAEGDGGSRLRLPAATPGEAIQESIHAAARGRSSGNIPGAGDGMSQLENQHPNFSTAAPIILSDTEGVDFGPYISTIVYIVKRNWYQVIPESARLGEKGRTAIVFEILKDGTVPQIRVVAASGSDPLDRAALAGIHASIPFPPLPKEFNGNHLVLEFIFLYNLGYPPQ